MAMTMAMTIVMLRCEVLNIPLACNFILCYGIILFFLRLMKIIIIIMDNFSFFYCFLFLSFHFVWKRKNRLWMAEHKVNLVSLCTLVWRSRFRIFTRKMTSSCPKDIISIWNNFDAIFSRSREFNLNLYIFYWSIVSAMRWKSIDV